MEIPHSITVTTGDQHIAYARIEGFFIGTRADILEQGYPDGPHFESSVRGLSHENGQLTDDKVHLFLYRGAVAATVLETRTELNNVRFDFFKNLENLV